MMDGIADMALNAADRRRPGILNRRTGDPVHPDQIRPPIATDPWQKHVMTIADSSQLIAACSACVWRLSPVAGSVTRYTISQALKLIGLP